MQNDVSYQELIQTLHEMVQKGLLKIDRIENGEPYYGLTKEGKEMAERIAKKIGFES